MSELSKMDPSGEPARGGDGGAGPPDSGAGDPPPRAARSLRSPFTLTGLSIALVWFVTAGYAVRERWPGNPGKTIISSDGRGYYAYLPAVFIDRDFSYSSAVEFDRRTFPPEYTGDFLAFHENGRLNKYFSGVAVLLLPFFLAACALSWATGRPVDGYAAVFQHGVSVGALFYLALGLFFLRRLLRLHAREPAAAFAIVCFGLGTNLFYYAHWEQAMSHVYSFSMIAMFFCFSKKYFSGGGARDFLPAVIALGLTALIRPVNVVVVLALPFFAEDLTAFKRRARAVLENRALAGGGLILFCSIVAVQPALYFAQTGKWLVYSYGKEGFNGLHPQILNVLFSYRKGLFVYAPIAFLSFLALPILFKQSRFRFFSLAGFLCAAIYILSSWWNWWYGASLGNRAFIDFYPAFALMLAVLWDSLKRAPLRLALLGAGGFCVYLNGVQTYQYKHFILHWDEMNRERYWQVFLNTQKRYMGYFFEERPDLDGAAVKRKVTAFNDMEGGGPSRTADKAYSGKYSVKMDLANRYSPAIVQNVADLGFRGKGAIRIRARVFSEEKRNDAVMVVTMEDPNANIYDWRHFELREYVGPEAGWALFECEMNLRPVRSPQDVMRFFFWSERGRTMWVDDLKVEFFEL